MIVFRLATPEDAPAIHRLNYETFVEEIPQHEPNEERRLVDRFYDTSTYWIGEQDGQLVAMCALRTTHPFSLEQKGVRLPPGEWMEIRLLAVTRPYRNTRTFAGLMRAVMEDALTRGVEGVVISGTTREQKLYRRFGFIPFAPPVGPVEARYIPMLLTRAAFFESETSAVLRPKLLLAGPVEISSKVRQALASQPMPHRSNEAKRLLQNVQAKLSHLVKLPYMYTLLGSGTVANDAVAVRLAGRGLILDTGEFGKRLMDHARRAGLSFDVLSVPHSEADWREVERYAPKWIWTVHCETSTGELVDMERLRHYAGEHDTVIAIDAISAVGTFAFDYSFADLVTFVSGKALRAAPGLAFVAMKKRAEPNRRIPRYLDLAQYDPIAFTQSMSLINALEVALDELTEAEIETHQRKMDVLQETLAKHGVPFKKIPNQAPGILALHLPNPLSSSELGNQLHYHGYRVQFESDYLKAANCLQISTMGWTTTRDVRAVATLVATWMQQKTATMERDGAKPESLAGPNDESYGRGVLS